MAATAEDVVSLDELKDQLRITFTDHNDLIRSLGKAAVGQIAIWTGLPLLDRTSSFISDSPAAAESPAVLTAVGLKEISSCKYWEQDQDRNEPPSGTIEKSKIYYSADPVYHHTYNVYHRDGYPAVASGSVLLFQCEVGIDDVPEDLKQAVILIVRDLYDGRKLQDNNSIDMLVRPHCVFVTENMVVSVPEYQGA